MEENEFYQFIYAFDLSELLQVRLYWDVLSRHASSVH